MALLELNFPDVEFDLEREETTSMKNISTKYLALKRNLRVN